MAFKDFDVEIQDEVGVIPEHFNGSVAIAGTPVTITPSSGKITTIKVYNPRKGTNANGLNDVLLVSYDGGTTYISVPRGEVEELNTYLDNFKIDANNNGVNYEVVITHD
jgi:hypothetical protein